MAQIKVNSAVMREKAGNLRSASNTIQSFTADMLNEMEGLRAYWEGEAGENLVNRFKGLSDNFEEIYSTVTKYAEFLEQAADTYDATEQAIAAGADAQAS